MCAPYSRRTKPAPLQSKTSFVGWAFQPREPNLSKHGNPYTASARRAKKQPGGGACAAPNHTFTKKRELRLA